MAAVERSSPPRPRMVIRIGVTGHRPNRIALDAVEGIEARCREVLTAIREACSGARSDALYAPDPPLLRIVTALAEGADRIAARAGLAVGAELQCPLPFPVAEYERDFGTPQSRAEFQTLLAGATGRLELDGTRANAEDAYENVGRTVLNQSDLVIAIWNGEPGAGRGGTAQIVGEALAQKLPVIWLDAKAARPPCLLAAGDKGATIERPLAALAAAISAIVEPLRQGGDEPGLEGAYFAERQPRYNFGELFKIFRDFALRGYSKRRSFRALNFERAVRAQWQQELARVPALSSAAVQMIMERLCPHYTWADQLAEHYAGLHRTSFVLNYFLGAFAVVFALAGLAFERPGADQFGAIVELFLIMAIGAITFLARQWEWHRRWIEYRQLAEQLRPLRFLALLASPLPRPHLPAHSNINPQRSWINWLYHAIARELGMVSATIDERYLGIVRTWLLDVELKDQTDYHARNAEISNVIESRLRGLGTALFLLAVVICIIAAVHGQGAPGRLTMAAAVLPALGAALYGIRNHGEFARIAERSLSMHREFDGLRTLLASAGPETKSLQFLRHIAEQAAEIMLAETIDWRFVFRLRPLRLPI